MDSQMLAADYFVFFSFFLSFPKEKKVFTIGKGAEIGCDTMRNPFISMTIEREGERKIKSHSTTSHRI